jgi:hypothetical protein
LPSRSNYSSRREPFEVLQNRWYNSLAANLHLDRDLFQIGIPGNPMIHSTEDLWRLLDVVPPLSLTFHAAAHPAKRFSDEYISLVSQFQNHESTLREHIGEDNHEKWLMYLSHIHPPPPDSKLPALFRRWAMLSAPSIMAAGVAKLSQSVILSRTLNKVEPYRGPQAKTIDFSPDLAQAKDIVEHSMGFDFAFDSGSSSENVEDTWTRGINQGPVSLWGGASAESALSRQFALGPVHVKISAKSYAVCTSVPGAWYSSALLNTAYTNHGTPPWPQNPSPTWEERFGPDGTMRRAIISLVLADGVNANVSSGAHFSEADRLSIKNNASKGLWPLYVPDADGEVSNKVIFNGDDSMNIETVTQAGTLVLLGNNVMEIGQYLAHAVP